MGGRTGRGMARGNAPFLERGCSESAGGVSQKKSRREPYIVRETWQGMRDSNPRKRSQSPVCYRYTNPLCGVLKRSNVYYYTQKRPNVKKKFPIFLEIFSFGGPCGRFPNLI